ncbi:MAG: cupredoxin domain-containing protein [Candidatus Sericytochromatia bacterium]|nr:cupredoxin domain-containing protein [Candidatus Tanganyikabacteria bacterium]
MPRLTSAALAALMLAIVPPFAGAQPLTGKTPNLESPRTTAVGQLHFPFTHRFGVVGSKVTNSPTLQLSTGLTPGAALAFRWASNSRLGGGTDPANPLHKTLGSANEVELSVKQALLTRTEPLPVDVTGILGYNTLANSGDFALVSGVPLGPVTLLATGKVFSNGFGAGLYTVAAGAGVQWHLTKFLQLQADAGGVLWAQNDPAIVLSSNTPALSLGLGFEIPYTPHTALLYVSNADTHTLQGTSRGAPPIAPFDPARTPAADRPGKIGAQILEQLRFGFEFNVPFSSLERWTHILAAQGAASPDETAEKPAEPMPEPPEATPQPAQPTAATPEATPQPTRPKPVAPEPSPQPTPQEQVVTISGLAYKPATVTVQAGTVVRWVNKDAMIHTVTSDKPGFDSGSIQPGAAWSRKFDKPGTYAYHCTPHPFMVGKVVVK